MPAAGRRRAPFRWDDATAIRVSDSTIHWFRPYGESGSIVVHIPTRSRFVLDGAGDAMWRGIVAGTRRAGVVSKLSERYGIAEVTASADLDDFVQELAAVGVVELLNETAAEIYAHS